MLPVMKAVGIASLGGAALLSTIIVLDTYHARRYGAIPAPRTSFVREGNSYVAAHGAMIEQSFDVNKRPDEFRVFVLGSSQAMGTPYVHQQLDQLSGRLLRMPNEGGLATWLAAYLQRLLPNRKVVVVNAAKGAHTLAASVATMRECLDIGKPDLIVILDGNNQRPVLEIGGILPETALRRAVDSQTTQFQADLREAVALAEKARVTTYLLTVPNNLRHYAPYGSAGERWWAIAKAADSAGDFVAARDAYIQAKDADLFFNRTRSPWNEAIRRSGSPHVHVIDMERIMFSYARDGIPGKDLFHDFCHMKLAANRVVAFEVAKRFRADSKINLPLKLEDIKMTPWVAGQLRKLYFISAFKWARAMLFAGRGKNAGNNRWIAANYWQDARTTEEQRALFLADSKIIDQ